jgi:hypothetical protein
MLNRNTQIILGVFLVLLLAMLWINRLPQDEAAVEDDFPTVPPSVALFPFGIEDVIGLEVRTLGGKTVSVARQGDSWTSITPSATISETDTLRLNNVVSQIALIKVMNANPLDLALESVGLDAPPYAITLTLADGTLTVMEIGDASITGTGYYVSVDGAPPQLVTKIAVDQALDMLNSPPLIPTPIIIPTEPITGTGTTEPPATQP